MKYKLPVNHFNIKYMELPSDGTQVSFISDRFRLNLHSKSLQLITRVDGQWHYYNQKFPDVHGHNMIGLDLDHNNKLYKFPKNNLGFETILHDLDHNRLELHHTTDFSIRITKNTMALVYLYNEHYDHRTFFYHSAYECLKENV